MIATYTGTSTLARLYDARRWDRSTHESYYLAYPTVLAIDALESECRRRGYALHRWDTASRHCSWIRTISYGITRADVPRPITSYDGAVLMVQRVTHEGLTERSQLAAAIDYMSSWLAHQP